MKLSLITIGLCALLAACGSPSEDHSSPNNVTEDYNPMPGGGGIGGMPCDRVYVIKITTDAGTFVKEVPVYCNPMGDEYHGDPPDYRQQWLVDPDPWDKQSRPQEILIRVQNERTQQSH